MLRVRERVKRLPKAPPNSFWYAAFSKREKIRQVFIKSYDQDIFQQLLQFSLWFIFSTKSLGLFAAIFHGVSQNSSRVSFSRSLN